MSNGMNYSTIIEIVLKTEWSHLATSAEDCINPVDFGLKNDRICEEEKGCP